MRSASPAARTPGDTVHVFETPELIVALWQNKRMPLSDNELIHAMFDQDADVASAAKRLYNERHANDLKPAEPPHCEECFEGCPKCQPEWFRKLKS
jgi:hypothetical protein